MDEIHIPHEMKARPSNVKTNIQINAKVQGIQNVNFQEVLTNLHGQQLISNISTQSGNVTLESLLAPNINLEDTGNTQNEKSPANEKNSSTSVKSQVNQDSSTTIFSTFNPQKPATIKESTLKPSDALPKKEEAQETEEKPAKIFENPDNTKPVKIKTVVVSKNKTSKEISPQKYYSDNSYKDSYIKDDNRKEDNILQSNYNLKLKKDNEYFLPQLPQNKENEDDEPDKRGKNKREKSQTENKIEPEEAFIFEIEKLIEAYCLKKPDFRLNIRNEKTLDNDLWLRSLIFDASKEALTSEDSEKLSKYISNQDKEISFTDREILFELLSEIFKHKVINLDSNLSSRLEKSGFDFIFRTFPDFILKGFIKKIVSESEKKKDREKISFSVFNFLNGLKNSDEDIQLLSSVYFNDFPEDEEQKTLSLMFGGRYLQTEAEKIRKIIIRMKENDSLPPGFTGSMYEIFAEQMENGHFEKSRQILSLLQVYVQGNDFSELESKVAAELIAKKYFNLKSINIVKVIDIIARLINGEKVDYLSLEIISKISEKGLLSYLPSRIDNDVKEFLKYLPFGNNEIKYNESSEKGSKDTTEFIFGGKVKIHGLSKLNQKFRIILSVFYFQDKEVINIYPESNGIFHQQFKSGNYQITDIKLIINDELVLIDFSQINHSSDLLFFNTDNNQNIFYFGTLKVFISIETLKMVKYSLKNDYKSFFDYMKNKLKISLKNRVIKINPKLIIK